MNAWARTATFVCLLGVTALVTAQGPGGGVPVCFKETLLPDPNDATCLKAPISNPCLDPTQVDANGWAATAGGKCGWKLLQRRRVPCGRPQVDKPCTGGYPI